MQQNYCHLARLAMSLKIRMHPKDQGVGDVKAPLNRLLLVFCSRCALHVVGDYVWNVIPMVVITQQRNQHCWQTQNNDGKKGGDFSV